MANLQLNIEVNDEEFKTLCSNNINSLPKEKLEEILLRAVETSLMHDAEDKYSNEGNILVAKKRECNGYYESYKYEPTAILKEVMKRIDLSDYTDVLAQKIHDYILNNYEEIIKKYVIESFAKLIFSEEKKYELKNELISDVSRMLERR